MQLRHVMSAALPAVLLTACLSGKETGPKFTLDVNAVKTQREQIVQVLRTPVLVSLFDTSYTAPEIMTRVGGPIDVLLARAGALMAAHAAPQPSLSRQPAAFAAATAPGSWLPEELRGQTYVRVNGGPYQADPERQSEAPANGVRIVLYERLSPSSYGTTPIGYLDLVVSSSGTKDIGTAKVADGAGATLASLTWTTETAGTKKDTYTITGTMGTSTKQIVVADTIDFTTGTNGKTTVRYAYHSAAPFASSEMAYGTPVFNIDSAPPALSMGIIANGHTVHFVPTGASSTLGDAAILINGYLVAFIDPAAVPKYVTPSGAPVSPEMIAFLDATSALAVSMPLGHSLVEDAKEMANRLSN